MVAPQPAADGQPPAPAAPPRAGRRVLWLGLLIAGCAAATVGMVVYLGRHIGAVPLGVGIALAILPVPVLVGIFLWLDRYEPSPTWIMLVSFLWGAGVATSVAIRVNSWAADRFADAGRPDALVGILVAPVVEDGLKAAFPLLLFIFHRKAFTGIIDGVVYCGLSATGFAMVENILYLGGHGYVSGAKVSPATGAVYALAVFIGRVPLTGFAHPLFTSMTGLGIGLAVRSPRKAVRVLAPITGLVAAMTLHATWNLMASFAAIDAYYLLYGYFAVFMPFFFLVVGLVLWLRSWEGRLAERVLPVYAAADWFSPPEVVALGTLGRRLSARAWARRVAGDAGLKAMKQYQYAATRLALLRDGIDRGLHAGPAATQAAVAEEHRLLSEIEQCRRVFTGRDPLTPSAWWSAGSYQIRFPDGVVRPVPEPPSPVVPVPYPLMGGAQRPG